MIFCRDRPGCAGVVFATVAALIVLFGIRTVLPARGVFCLKLGVFAPAVIGLFSPDLRCHPRRGLRQADRYRRGTRPISPATHSADT